jgi:N-acetylmuramoyl-L-alanine amidase
MNITKKLIKYNFTSDTNSPQFITIHDSGNYDVGANAQMHFNYFNSGNKSASAHYFVDDKSILQLVEDKDSSWHCGDGQNKYGINNNNSIGVEICVNSDGDYNKTIENTIDLVVELMQKYNIPIDRIVRHFDASRKDCPKSMNNGNWTKWFEFKNRIQLKLIKEVIHTMFKDEDKIAGYAKPSVEKLYKYGIIKGDSEGNFNPTKAITRQDMACVIANLLTLLGK